MSEDKLELLKIWCNSEMKFAEMCATAYSPHEPLGAYLVHRAALFQEVLDKIKVISEGGTSDA